METTTVITAHLNELEQRLANIHVLIDEMARETARLRQTESKWLAVCAQREQWHELTLNLRKTSTTVDAYGLLDSLTNAIDS